LCSESTVAGKASLSVSGDCLQASLRIDTAHTIVTPFCKNYGSVWSQSHAVNVAQRSSDRVHPICGRTSSCGARDKDDRPSGKTFAHATVLAEQDFALRVHDNSDRSGYTVFGSEQDVKLSVRINLDEHVIPQIGLVDVAVRIGRDTIRTAERCFERGTTVAGKMPLATSEGLDYRKTWDLNFRFDVHFRI
jgi:hypothetical protein